MDRIALHNELVDILGSNRVYFQPPENFKIGYPCIIYSLSNIDSRFADDTHYHMYLRYLITYIDKNPDSDIPKQLLQRFDYTSFDRTFVAEGLHHTAINIYF